MEQKDSERDTTQSAPEGEKHQKDFESRLDEYANKISKVVNDGVKRVEEAFDKGKENLRSSGAEEGEEGGKKGSTRTGIVLIGIGIVWLLYIIGLFGNPTFPILLIVLGIYFLVRKR
jgi:hypothetical protein